MVIYIRGFFLFCGGINKLLGINLVALCVTCGQDYNLECFCILCVAHVIERSSATLRIVGSFCTAK